MIGIFKYGFTSGIKQQWMSATFMILAQHEMKPAAAYRIQSFWKDTRMWKVQKLKHYQRIKQETINQSINQ